LVTGGRKKKGKRNEGVLYLRRKKYREAKQKKRRRDNLLKKRGERLTPINFSSSGETRKISGKKEGKSHSQRGGGFCTLWGGGAAEQNEKNTRRGKREGRPYRGKIRKKTEAPDGSCPQNEALSFKEAKEEGRESEVLGREGWGGGASIKGGKSGGRLKR